MEISSVIAGEKTAESGTFRCQKCGMIVRVESGETVPKCFNCAHDLYDRLQ